MREPSKLELAAERLLLTEGEREYLASRRQNGVHYHFTLYASRVRSRVARTVIVGSVAASWIGATVVVGIGIGAENIRLAPDYFSSDLGKQLTQYRVATESCDENKLVAHPNGREFVACVDGVKHSFTIRPGVTPATYNEIKR